jgi:hypothetical protein
MPIFQCRRCGHEFNKKAYYIDHVNRVNICLPILNDVSINITNFIELDGNFICNGCNKKYSSLYSLNRHSEKCPMLNQNKIISINKEENKEENKEVKNTFIYYFKDKLMFNTFDSLINYFKDISEQRKGNLFEIFCKNILLYTNKNIVNIWRICELPPLQQKKFEIFKDKGIDLIINDNNSYKAVQCKFRTDLKKVFKYEEISTFFGQLFLTELNGIFMTSVIKNCRELERTNKIEKYNYDFFIKFDGNNEFYNLLFSSNEFNI